MGSLAYKSDWMMLGARGLHHAWSRRLAHLIVDRPIQSPNTTNEYLRPQRLAREIEQLLVEFSRAERNWKACSGCESPFHRAPRESIAPMCFAEIDGGARLIRGQDQATTTPRMRY